MSNEDTVIKGLIRHALTFAAGVLTVYAAKKGVAVPPEAVEGVVSNGTEVIAAVGLGVWGAAWSIVTKLKKKVTDRIRL